MSKRYDAAVFIGRFQPFHDGHLASLRKGFEVAKDVVMVLGSANAPTSVRNPLTVQQRVDLIVAAVQSVREFPEAMGGGKAYSYSPGMPKFTSVSDYPYDDHTWATSVRNKVRGMVPDAKRICIVGAYKDESSYFLKVFPEWDFIPEPGNACHATDIRNAIFDRDEKPHGNEEDQPWTVQEGITEEKWKFVQSSMRPASAQWLMDHYIDSPAYVRHVQEHWEIKQQVRQFGYLGKISVTVDSVVVCNGHVLVVRRGQHPGKFQIALPGGYLESHELLVDGARRELLEETGVDVRDVEPLASKSFDGLGRSSRGRTITNAFLFKIEDHHDFLPRPTAGDDAGSAFWLSIDEALSMKDQFFADHWYILTYFLLRTTR